MKYLKPLLIIPTTILLGCAGSSPGSRMRVTALVSPQEFQEKREGLKRRMDSSPNIEVLEAFDRATISRYDLDDFYDEKYRTLLEEEEAPLPVPFPSGGAEVAADASSSYRGSDPSPPQITPDEFEVLSYGMTYEECSRIIGESGTLITDSHNMFQYHYEGEEGAFVILTFTGRVLSHKVKLQI